MAKRSRITAKRLESASDVLHRFETRFRLTHRINCGEFERQLKACWGVGYQGLKGLLADLSLIDRYRYLVAYHMEHASHSPCLEFKRQLAKLYGTKQYPDDKRNKKRREFWSKALYGAN